MPTHSSILAWEIPWTQESGGLQSIESQESDMSRWLHRHQYFVFLWPFYLHGIFVGVAQALLQQLEAASWLLSPGGNSLA